MSENAALRQSGSASAVERKAIRIRSIKSEPDMAALVSFSVLRNQYLTEHDILGLPKTLGSVAHWLGAYPKRKIFGSFTENNRCVGICVWSPQTRMGHLSYAVDPEFQRRGIASALISYASSKACMNQVDAKPLDLLVDVENVGSIRVARACGFVMSADSGRAIRMRFGCDPALRSFAFMEYFPETKKPIAAPSQIERRRYVRQAEAASVC